MKIMKWLKKERINPVKALRGDSITISYKGEILLKTNFINNMTFDEVGIFEGMVGERDVIGGVIMGKKEN
jgi:hypothetical protein